ncbi:MAG: ribbon-helix-helix domain-containing protein [Desulfobacterales bacterium]|nr:ribbon-helix-helix domain-containing protein [Desulfobacterales bacterium]
MAKKDKINTAFSMITGGEKGKAKTEHVNPVGVALDPGELARLDEIAKELEQSRHAVLKYAVKDFIRRYNQGERPKTKTETKTILNPE